MVQCTLCGEAISGLGWDCNYCTGEYCRDHRFPEEHDCPGVENANTLGPEFRTEQTVPVTQYGENVKTAETPTNASEFNTGRSPFWILMLIFLVALTVFGVGMLLISFL